MLIISLRAQGDSTGDSNDMGFSSRHDVVAVVDFMKKRCPESPIIIHGLSMGAAAAVIGSGELADRVEGYILESPYRDLRTAVRNRTQNALPPLLDRIAYLGLLIVSPLVLPNLDKTAPVEAIKAIPADVPVLILAGEEDPVARPVEARAIFDRVQSHGRLVFVPHAGHLNFPETCPDLYQRCYSSLLMKLGSREPCFQRPSVTSRSRVAHLDLAHWIPAVISTSFDAQSHHGA